MARKLRMTRTYASQTVLPQVLRQWRRENGVKLAAAAAALKVSVACWGHWETGARFPCGKSLLRLSDYTGIPVPRLLCPHACCCPQLR